MNTWCLFVGGVANGVYRQVDIAQERVQVERPDYVKPLESSDQTMPETVTKSDIYVIHPLSLRDDDDARHHVTALAVIEGEALTWAFKEMIMAYIKQSMQSEH